MRTRTFSSATTNTTNTTYNNNNKEKYRYLEFKYLYFKLQKIIEKKVVLSLKYEQLKTPEIYSALIKPITNKIISVSSTDRVRQKLSKCIPSHVEPMQTPKFGPQFDAFPTNTNYGTPLSHNIYPRTESKVSIYLIYILFMLRYEYMIQSENNLIRFDLLVTKANLCEILAIRILREYKAIDRINLLFVNPMKFKIKQGRVPYHNASHLFTNFNTLELSILSKAKKFLSQPVLIHILDRFYNGELIIRDYSDSGLQDEDYNGVLRSLFDTDDNLQQPGEHTSLVDNNDAQDNIINYKYNQVSINKIMIRSNIVPKYQSLVINLKYICLTLLYLILIINNKNITSSVPSSQNQPMFIFTSIVETMFWLLAMSFNFEFLIKIMNIEYKFLKKIIWTYVDIIILILINITFTLRIITLIIDSQLSSLYYDCFSVISIILFPRMLSIFNNYEFFHMIILSLKKMLWNMIGMVCLFISLIFGFYLCFISLTLTQRNYEVAFDMLKIFFGFTPAVWGNWENYNAIGKMVQMCYLFLIQFIIGTILAIVLGNVFAKVNQSNKEEFEYFKTINLIIYLKWGHLYYYNKFSRFTELRVGKMGKRGSGDSQLVVNLTMVINGILNLFKLPIILIIFIYELIVHNQSNAVSSSSSRDLKKFTFLNKLDDYYSDADMLTISKRQNLVDEGNDSDDSDISLMLMKNTNRRRSSLTPSSNFPANARARHTSQLNNVNFAKSTHSRKSRTYGNVGKQPNGGLVQVQSIATLGNLRSASTDSLFIDEMLGKKYGIVATEPTPSNHTNSGGSGYSGSTVVHAPGLERVRTNNSESLVNQTPESLAAAATVNGNRVISSLNISSPVEAYGSISSRRKGFFDIKKQKKRHERSADDTSRFILQELQDMKDMIGKLQHGGFEKDHDETVRVVGNQHTHGDGDTEDTKDQINETILHGDDHSEESIIVKADAVRGGVGDDVNFMVHTYSGRQDSEGEMYDLPEVSLDDIASFGSSRRSQSGYGVMYTVDEMVATDDEESEQDTDDYGSAGSDDTF